MGILGKALAGAGQGAAIVGLEEFRNQAIAMRDQRLAEIAQASQERGFAHADASQQRGFEQQTNERTAAEGFQRGMETEVKQPFQLKRDESAQKQARELQESDQKFRAGEGDKNRELDKRRIGMEGARLSLAQQQFVLAQQQAALAIESGKLDLESKKRMAEVVKSIDQASTPEELERATAKLYAMTGKDKYSPVVGKDEQGNPQFLGGFDTRTGTMKQNDKPVTPPSAADIEGLRKRAGDPNAVAFFESKFGQGSASKYAPQQQAKPQQSAAPKAPSIPSEPIQQNSAFSSAANLAQQQLGIPDEQAGGILKALQTPNLSTEQKSALSLQLQKRMRELGIMGK
jgi:hypothetical protein